LKQVFGRFEAFKPGMERPAAGSAGPSVEQANLPIKQTCQRSFAISAVNADPLGCDPLAPRDEKSLEHLLRSSFEQKDKTLASDARSPQALSFSFYFLAFHPCKGNVEAQSNVPLELLKGGAG
jgi:hypothetical protein